MDVVSCLAKCVLFKGRALLISGQKRNHPSLMLWLKRKAPGARGWPCSLRRRKGGSSYRRTLAFLWAEDDWCLTHLFIWEKEGKEDGTRALFWTEDDGYYWIHLWWSFIWEKKGRKEDGLLCCYVHMRIICIFPDTCGWCQQGRMSAGCSWHQRPGIPKGEREEGRETESIVLFIVIVTSKGIINPQVPSGVEV